MYGGLAVRTVKRVFRSFAFERDDKIAARSAETPDDGVGEVAVNLNDLFARDCVVARAVGRSGVAEYTVEEVG